MPINLPWNFTQAQLLQARTNVLTSGGNRKPESPRSVIAQPACNSVVLSWVRVRTNHPACRTRIYLDIADCLYQEHAPGVNSAVVPADGGPTPKPRSIYLSFVTPAGFESRKINVQQSAAPQANGAPPPPNPGTGGGGGGRYCFSGETEIIGEHGLIAFRDVRVGDVILTGAGTLRPVAELHRHEYDGNLVTIDGGLVTESHELLSLSEWRPASQLFAGRTPFRGDVFNLTVETSEPLDLRHSPRTERSYVLAVSGMIAHNLKIVAP